MSGCWDAMAGDATLFARQDYVEEAWRIVDPYLQSTTPVYAYEPKTWSHAKSIRGCCPRAVGITRQWVAYLHPADKYHRLTRRLSQGHKGLEKRALMASQQPAEAW